VSGVLADAGYHVEAGDSFAELAERLRRPDGLPLVVLTGVVPEAAGREFLRRLRAGGRRPPVLAVLDAPRSVAEEMRRLGVDEVLGREFDPEELLLVARHLLGRLELERSTRILGRSRAVQEVLEKVAQFAPVSSTVLIEGESGTGKELVARAIHDLSPRAGRPFVPVNCGGFTETLLESELFGHERGAFTGAVAQRKGVFEQADRGTLFLDEVGDMPLSTQVRLLRAVEDRAFLRVGGSEPVRVDVRLIAATNRVLRDAVEAGTFRRDLYYRLDVLHLTVPPLRDRPEDVPLLVRHFLDEFARQEGREPLEVDETAMQILQEYGWPGNVRELRNEVEQLAVLARGPRIEAADVTDALHLQPLRGRVVPLGSAGGGSDGRASAESEFLVGSLLELRRGVAEIRRLLEDVSARTSSLGDLTELVHGGIEAVVEDAGGGTPADEGAGGATPEPPELAVSRPALLPRALPSGERDGLPFRPGTRLDDLEREAIRRTLEGVGGNRRRAAALLGIGERTLYRKIKEYGLEIDRGRGETRRRRGRGRGGP
jgi:DNA-binding NtrC family response regulator